MRVESSFGLMNVTAFPSQYGQSFLFFSVHCLLPGSKQHHPSSSPLMMLPGGGNCARQKSRCRLTETIKRITIPDITHRKLLMSAITDILLSSYYLYISSVRLRMCIGKFSQVFLHRQSSRSSLFFSTTHHPHLPSCTSTTTSLMHSAISMVFIS